MARYYYGHKVTGFEPCNIGDKQTYGNGNVCVITMGTDSFGIRDYYNWIRDMAISGTKIIMVNVGEVGNNLKVLLSLMAQYRQYNAYCVNKASDISDKYIAKLLDREATIEEIQTYIGGDVGASSNLQTILVNISSMAMEGDFEGLKEYTEANVNNLEEVIKALGILSTWADINNSGSVVEELKKARELYDKISTEHENQQKELLQREEKITELRGNIGVLEARISSIGNGSDEKENALGVFKAYAPVNTTAIKCKTRTIVYFKEITSIPYINTMVSNLFEVIQMKAAKAGKKAKLLIYDSASTLAAVYKPLPIVGTAEYTKNAQALRSSSDRFVVIEPNPYIMEDLVKSMSPVIDVLVVYDRMHQATDLITGNNVTKFWVMNSKREYESLKDMLHISDKSYIISRVGAGIDEAALDIPTIDKFGATLETARLAKYKKLLCSDGKTQLINEISRKIMLDSL